MGKIESTFALQRAAAALAARILPCLEVWWRRVAKLVTDSSMRVFFLPLANGKTLLYGGVPPLS